MSSPRRSPERADTPHGDQETDGVVGPLPGHPDGHNGLSSRTATPPQQALDLPSVHTPHLIPSDFLHLIKYLEESRISSENRRWVEEEERRSREEK